MRELPDELSALQAEAGLNKTRPECPVQMNWRTEAMQNVSTIIKRPVPVGSAAASGVLAFVAGALIALAVPGLATAISVSNGSGMPASHTGAERVLSGGASVASEPIARNRSEKNLGAGGSVGSEPIAHNRSEKNLGA
jgi:hypothetical protein